MECLIINEDEKFVIIKAGAGVIWQDLVLYCIERNFGGIENLSLIPGTVGAAPIQNIGAYGQEIKNVFENLDGFFLNDSKPAKFTNKECKFGYRNSIFKNKLNDKFIVTYVTIRLSKNPIVNLEYGNVKSEIEKMRLDNPDKVGIGIKEVSNVICRIRLSKLPDPAKIGNAGSFFKNPEIFEERFLQLKNNYTDITGFNLGNGKIKVPAGWLIESCGWKGKIIGNTGAHAKQALVLVNYGNASGKEILNLAKEIKKSVFDKFGIELKEEVSVI